MLLLFLSALLFNLQLCIQFPAALFLYCFIACHAISWVYSFAVQERSKLERQTLTAKPDFLCPSRESPSSDSAQSFHRLPSTAIAASSSPLVNDNNYRCLLNTIGLLTRGPCYFAYGYAPIERCSIVRWDEVRRALGMDRHRWTLLQRRRTMMADRWMNFRRKEKQAKQASGALLLRGPFSMFAVPCPGAVLRLSTINSSRGKRGP